MGKILEFKPCSKCKLKGRINICKRCYKKSNWIKEDYVLEKIKH